MDLHRLRPEGDALSNPVTTEKTVKAEAADPKRGMTLDELAAFVQEAMRAEIPGTTVVKAVATWRSNIKRAEVKG
jgi:hypothetical protein